MQILIFTFEYIIKFLMAVRRFVAVYDGGKVEDILFLKYSMDIIFIFLLASKININSKGEWIRWSHIFWLAIALLIYQLSGIEVN